MKSLSQSTQFVHDLERMLKRGKRLDKLQGVVRKLAHGEALDPRHRDCHVEPDWVLIYTSDASSLRLDRTGTHADLFE